jgi:3-carboxy-cis,cis-muconate cycloisomerase
MAALVPGSLLFRDLFGTAAMRELFADRALVQRYLDVEAALARVQARLGLIPEEAAREIAAKADAGNIDLERMAARTAVVGYPILPLVEQLSAVCRDGLGQYSHWGATTQDIMDTADVLQMREALALISAELDAIAATLAALAAAHRDTPMAGRTHLQHALPITFGYKAAVWLSAVDRHRARLAEMRPRVLVGEFAGAAGTLASLGPNGLAVHDALMAELGLGTPSITWHAARDGMAEVSGLLALIAGSLGKIATDIMLMMQSELGEVFEPFVPGRGASSTMPQKRNPIACEFILGIAKAVRQHHATMLDAMLADHERATGPWHAEWLALPEAFVLTAGALAQARALLAGLEVDPAAMRRNLETTGGLIVSEAAMMALAPKLGRQRAHDAVYDCCREALRTRAAFVDVLAAHPEIAPLMRRDELATVLAPENYLGSAQAMVDRLLTRRS